MTVDVVVIGGGIVGCACAYYLSAAGLKVQLLEKGAIGSGASKAGMCHIVTWEEPPIHVKLEMASKKLYAKLTDELPVDMEYRPTGSLALIQNESSYIAMRDLVIRLGQSGHRCEMIQGREMRQLEPLLAEHVFGGALFHDDVQVNPLLATQAFALGARRMGGLISPFQAATGIILNAQGTRIEKVRTEKEDIPTKYVVNAAGAWAGDIGKMNDLVIPIIPRKGHLAVTEPLAKGILCHQTLFSAGYLDAVSGGDELAIACNIQQTQHGNLLLGSSRQFAGFDTTVEPHVLSKMLKLCAHYFPFLKTVKILRTWAGLRPYTPDLLPIISPVPWIEGYMIAAGHEGLGITEGPITGKLITQLILGEAPAFPIEQLAFTRFMPD